MSRRTVLAGAPLVQIAALASAAPIAPAVFTPAQMQLIEAVTERLIPADELGPGAREAGVPVYLERSFAGPLSADRGVFSAGLDAMEAVGFTKLSTALQNDFLAAMERNEVSGFRPDSRAFFIRLRQLTLEGMFGDPGYGGNQNYAGWDLIRYPGPRMAVSAEDQRLREPIKPLRVSARKKTMGAR